VGDWGRFGCPCRVQVQRRAERVVMGLNEAEVDGRGRLNPPSRIEMRQRVSRQVVLIQCHVWWEGGLRGW
jgi:hypothetical protein